MSWQDTLIDEESSFLRGVNEGYRTWCLRHQKIQQLLKTLEVESECQQPTQKIDVRVQQLKAMTVGGQLEDSEDSSIIKMKDAESAMKEVGSLPESYFASLRATPVEGLQLSMTSASSVTQAAPSNCPDQCVLRMGFDLNTEVYPEGGKRDDTDHALRRLRECMHELDLEVEEVFERKYDADMELKEFEQSVLAQWQEKKRASEHHTRRHAALTGMQYAMRAVLSRHEWRLRSPEDFLAAGAAALEAAAAPEAQEPAAAEAEAEAEAAARGPPPPREAGGPAASWDGPEPQEPGEAEDAASDSEAEPEAGLPALSDVLAESVTDPKRREEILKREHPGSAEHPYGCRACHFQGGLCWKGLACSFCHICPKPKRKSKHQRDVDKRRQERYRQVKDDLGIECLDELTKIDDSRRQIMTSSEELKKRVKDAYASERRPEITDAKQMVSKMQSTMDMYHASVPFLLAADGARGQGPRAAELPPPPPPPAAPQPEAESGAQAGAGAPREQGWAACAEEEEEPAWGRAGAACDAAGGGEPAEQGAEESDPDARYRHRDLDDGGSDKADDRDTAGRGPEKPLEGNDPYAFSRLWGSRGSGKASGRRGRVPPGSAQWQSMARPANLPPDGWSTPTAWGSMVAPPQHRRSWLDQGQLPDYDQVSAADQWWFSAYGGASNSSWGMLPYQR